jgi:2-(1,2-epoxy-1,2-dihydrophenyl)acetyl-CoA isomerase
MADVGIARDGAVTTITLNRPDVLNALNRPLLANLRRALEEAGEPEVRAVVLAGAGRGFCVGQDLEEFPQLEGKVTDHIRDGYHPVIHAIRSLEKPVVAAIHGPIAGAGLGLALACDQRISADDASFVPGFIGIGLVPDSGVSFFLTHLLGPARAFGWLATNRRLTAAEAYDWGLVDEVVEAGTFEETVRERAAAFAAAPTRGIGMTKRLLHHAVDASLADQLELEAATQTSAAGTDDFREGVAAFLEKRKPQFTGR